MMGVYEIYCRKTGKRYIGSSKDIKKRWQSHLSSLKRKAHHNYYLQKSYLRYGEDNLVFSVLEEVKKIEDLYTIEEKYIKKFKFNRLFNAMRKPGAYPKKKSRWMSYCEGQTVQQEEQKEEWAFGD
jgi:group I intron endonuclease